MRRLTIGDRFQKDRRDPLTGAFICTHTYRVTEIEPELFIGQRAALLNEQTGQVARPDVEQLGTREWPAIGNVLPFRAALAQQEKAGADG